MTPFIDRTCEQSVPTIITPVGGALAWSADDIEPERCVVHLDEAASAELRALADHVRSNPLPIALRRRDELALPALGRAMIRANELLSGIPGVAIVDRLPMNELDRDSARALFWIIGQFVGRQVAQKWDGTMLYDVHDSGQRYAYGVRGSYTNVELVFHTDNAFAMAPPDRVGLMCFHPAREGGVSRFCSLIAVHDRMLAEDPRALSRLYECVYFDRQAEHAPGEPPVMLAPVFHRDGDRLLSRMNVSLIRKGYEVAGEPMDEPLEQALAALDALLEDPRQWFELPIERGQLQFLNNVTTAHYRSEFVDHDEPERKRHLVRTWHRDWGRVSYDA